MIVYHYTNIDTLEKILAPCNDGNQIFNLRATHCNFLNDTMENVIGLFILAKCIMQIECELNIPINHCIFPFFTKENHSIILKNMKHFKPNGVNTFTLSFCKDDDDLPMWLMYGNKGNGITLGVDNKKVILNWEDGYYNIEMGECTYWTPEMREMKSLYSMRDLYNLIKERYLLIMNPKVREAFNVIYSGTDKEKEYQINFTHAVNLASYCSIFNKEDRWKNEKEYRISVSGFPNKIGFHKSSNGTDIPHLDVNIPINALKSITIGPTCESSAYDKIKLLLYEHKIADRNISIIRSTQPLQML